MNKRNLLPDEKASVDSIVAKAKSGQIDLNTEYQRDPNVWTVTDKKLLINSILREVDIPKIYLASFVVETDEKEEERYECIDGKQRITALIEFYDEKYKIDWDDAFEENWRDDLKTSGKKFSDLSHTELDKLKSYQLSVVVIPEPSDEDISLLFTRVNLGEPLNGAEKLKAKRGYIRDVVFEENGTRDYITIGENGPFIGKVNLKNYRFSREVVVAQMLINSIKFKKESLSDNPKWDFNRARWENLAKFFDRHKERKEQDVEKIKEIYQILEKIEETFGNDIKKLRKRGEILSCYLFSEKLIIDDDPNFKKFPEFYTKLLERIQEELDKITDRDYEKLNNDKILDNFNKYVQQATAESYAIGTRHNFLKEAFPYYLETGKILGD